MSHNPWPYVIVMLGSLGFLANLMAQQNNRFSNQPAFNNNAQDGAGSLSVRVADDQNRSNRFNGLDEPSFGDSNDGRAGLESQSFDDIIGDRSGRRGATFRRDSEPEVSQIPIRPRTRGRTNTPNLETVSPPVGGGRADFPTNQRRQRFNEQPTLRTNPSITRENVNDTQFGGSRFKTQETSLFDQQRAPGSLEPRIVGQTPAQNKNAILQPFGSANKSSTNDASIASDANTNASKPTLGGGIASVFGGGSTASGKTDPSGFTPAWFKWALLFSIGANLFFGYIAMNMHTRYQDLIEDMHASESRLERQRPRHRESARRVHEHDDEPTSSRQRRRDADEAAFLQGGIEV